MKQQQQQHKNTNMNHHLFAFALPLPLNRSHPSRPQPHLRPFPKLWGKTSNGAMRTDLIQDEDR